MIWQKMVILALVLGGLVALIVQAIWCLGWGVCTLLHWKMVPYRLFGWLSVVLMLTVWGVVGYGYLIGRWQVEVKEVTFRHADLPEAFDGYRIAHISDLHVDSYEQPEKLQRVMEQVTQLAPDIIMFTGDMASRQLETVYPYADALRALKAKDGVVAVMGNHDFFIYDRRHTTRADYAAAADRLTAFERDTLGWTVLRNEHIYLHRGADSIVVAGVDNINGNAGFETIQMGDLKRALGNTNQAASAGMFTVLLTHDPTHWRSEVLPASAVQLTLSGHTHSAQMRLLGWTPSRWLFDEYSGPYYEDGRMLYVNAGIGGVVPFRFNCPSEVTVITLRR